jgi:hypothetical protein
MAVNDPWTLDKPTHESGLRWLFQDYPTKHPFERTKADTIATRLKAYGHHLLNATHLARIFEQNIHAANQEPICVDIEGSMEFHKLHWETMESAYIGIRDSLWPHILIRRTIIPTFTQDPCHGNLTLHDATLKRPFNILLAVARQPNSDDIDPFLSASVLSELCKQRSAGLEIARPGTWKAFERLLTFRTHQWHEKGGTGPWFDIVHFDMHGSVKESEAYIHFLSGSGKKTFLQNSANVGKMLARNHVTTVFLNACESGYLGGEPKACFAGGLIDAGVPSVMAMSHSLTNTAASIIVSKFYTSLLNTRLDFWAASGAARQALRDSTLRDCRFGRKVELEDSIIPVIFVSKSATDRPWAHGHSPLDTSSIPDHPTVARIFANMDDDHTTPRTPSRVGRESDFLKMEWLASSDNSDGPSSSRPGKTILLNGGAGVGKTAFAKDLASWWIDTNFVQHATRLDMLGLLGDSTPLDICAELKSTSAASAGRTVYILDHLECRTISTAEKPLDKEDRSRFKDAIGTLVGSDNIVIVISRRNEEWLQVPTSQRHELQNLDPYSATIFASNVYHEYGYKSALESRDEATALEVLVCRLDYNPLSIKAFLSALLERSSGVDDCKPSIFLEQILRRPGYIPLLRSSHYQVFGVRLFLQNLCAQQGIKTDVILSRLALTAGWFNEDWYQLIYRSGGLQIGLNDAVITTFLKKHLLTSGWVRKAPQPYQLSAAYLNERPQAEEGLDVNGYYMHAMLINAVRERWVPRSTPLEMCPDLPREQYRLFADFMIGKAIAYYKLNENHTAAVLQRHHIVEAEAFSLLTAFEVCFQDVLEPFTSEPGKEPKWGVYGPIAILEQLHQCSIRTSQEIQTAPQTVALTSAMIFPRMERVQNYLFLRLAVGQLDEEQGTGFSNVEHCITATRTVAELHIVRNPMKAGQYIALCLGLIRRYSSRVVTSAWGVQHNLAWLLMALSYCIIYTRSPVEPTEILQVALQACRLIERQIIIVDPETDPPICKTFDLARERDIDWRNIPYQKKLFRKMLSIGLLRLGTFKALRMTYQAMHGEEQMNKYGLLEESTEFFFFESIAEETLHALSQVNIETSLEYVLSWACIIPKFVTS